jgi:hypothetical protein
MDNAFDGHSGPTQAEANAMRAEEYRDMATALQRERQRAEAAEDRLDAALSALRQIKEWSDAYPLKVWPEPTKAEWTKAVEALRAAGLTIDAISASNMRHVITQVGEIALKGLAEGGKP